MEGTKQFNKQEDEKFNMIRKVSVSKYTITKCAFLSSVAYMLKSTRFWGDQMDLKYAGRGPN